MSEPMLHPSHQKDFVFKRREFFFDEIINVINQPPGEIDRVMEQTFGDMEVFHQVHINDHALGNLVILSKYGDVADVMYSIHLIGKTLKIGVLLDPNQVNPHAIDMEHAMKQKFVMSERGNKLLAEWVFEDEDIYSNYVSQEGYIMSIRHLHFRVMNGIKRYIEKENF